MARVRYQALGPLLAGEGSRAFMGLEIKDEAEARPVVLIWVPTEAASDPAQLSALQKETRRATQLIHPNILRVYDLARVDDGIARVVEFADGESLRSVIKEAKKLPPPLAALVAADAATGVYFAHEAGNDDGTPLVHGDLRPETLLVSFNGLCTVTGYGALSVAPREAGGKRVPGRRFHCAPEQLVGGRESIRTQTDVYLLGLILYECLTGTVPFEGEADFDQAVLTQTLPLLDSDDVPPSLRPLIAKACAKKVTDRYASAIAFREALERAQTLPPREELAALLDTLFPSHGEIRAARRREIDAGIAGFARSQWAERRASGVNPPAPTEAAADATSPPAPAHPTPTPGPAPSAPAGPPAIAPVAAPPARRSSLPLIIGIALGFGAVVLLIAVLGRRAPPPPPPPPPPPVVAIDASVAVVVAPEADAGEDAGPANPDAGSVALDGGAEETTLELVIEPPVDASVDGSPAQRTPFTVPLPPGKHRVQVSDRRAGINFVRNVTVGPKGKTREEIHLGRGYVTVSAPEGAAIVIDGRSAGKAPLHGELTLFEGSHQIVVTVGKAKWQQAFSVRTGEHAYFNVEAQ
jgi:serine/threonine protein kinase